MPQVMQDSRFLSVADEQEALRELRKISDFLDSKYHLPFGWKIGWDGLLGLIPGVGDLFTNLVSFYILYKAALLGCPLSVVLRMGLNLLIDNVVDTIPLIGNLFDFMWKANNKNVALLENYIRQPVHVTRASRTVVMATLVLMAAALILIGVLTFYLARWMWGVFQTAW
ncbi:MAG: DUF4112 domain-containing protein [Pseudobdellovibrionaceae bacterium]